MPFDKGVDYYTKATAVIVVNFPEGKTICQWCPYCRNEDSLKRHKCIITDEMLVYPFLGRGNECPLIVEEIAVTDLI
jgi:thiol-disulfide isomerase/thioredoxin